MLFRCFLTSILLIFSAIFFFLVFLSLEVSILHFSAILLAFIKFLMHVSYSASLFLLLECCLAFIKLSFFSILVFDSVFFPKIFKYFCNRLLERITNTYPAGANSIVEETRDRYPTYGWVKSQSDYRRGTYLKSLRTSAGPPLSKLSA